jgi:4-hydroxybenzoate polyprenyltransferase
LLVFLPLSFSIGERWSFTDTTEFWSLLGRSAILFAIFCALAGSQYLFNDTFDAPQDRLHAKKRNRPIASGLVPAPLAIASGILLLIGSVTGSFLLDLPTGFVCLSYLVLNISYSSLFKHIAIVDVMALSTSYILRVVAGSETIDVATSPWLYITIGTGALFIACGKRFNELRATGNDATKTRQVLGQYSLPLLNQFITIAGTSALVSYALYTFSAANAPANHSMMLTVPFVIFGLFRYLYIISQSDTGETPEVIFVKDVPLIIDVLLWVVAIVLILVLNQ